MKVIVAMDSFKGCLSSREAGNAAAEGIRQVWPEAEVIVRPLADGGEGTVAALAEGLTERVTVTGPLGEPVVCEYGILGSGNMPGGGTRADTSFQDNTCDNLLAVIECSGACGLTHVPQERRNPMYTTTYGLGEVILDAAAKGCRRFLIGLGGSATNDGGAGMLQALGYRLTDTEGHDIGYGAAGLMRLASIRRPETNPASATPATESMDLAHILSECTFRVACDVTNPLCGPLGCSAVFGPQKGARAEDIPVMDEALRRYAELVQAIRRAPDAMTSTPTAVASPEAPGSGAAGGLGFAFRAVLGAELVPGSQLVIEETKLEDYIADADLVITGEGRLDAQTAMGKAPAAVAALADAHGVPAIALAGSVTAEEDILRKMGFRAWYGINDRAACDLATAMQPEVARRNMTETAVRAARDLGGV
ncbi:MAG: glycerate kinase [Lachnospiraceae bacterium]|nr:glycerate kinase [Lachnospiraceae bacterium]